eukprot:jgi/Mesvir1/17331/Mv07726-RA.1
MSYTKMSYERLGRFSLGRIFDPPIKKIRGILSSVPFRQAMQVALGCLVSYAPVLVPGLQFQGACLTTILFLTASLLHTAQPFVGAKIFAGITMVSASAISAVLGGVTMVLAHAIAPGDDGDTYVLALCILTAIGLCLFASLRTFLPMAPQAVIATFLYGMTIMRGRYVDPPRDLWRLAVWPIFGMGAIGGIIVVLGGMLFMPDLAFDALVKELSGAVVSLGHSISWYSTAMWDDAMDGKVPGSRRVWDPRKGKFVRAKGIKKSASQSSLTSTPVTPMQSDMSTNGHNTFGPATPGETTDGAGYYTEGSVVSGYPDDSRLGGSSTEVDMSTRGVIPPPSVAETSSSDDEPELGPEEEGVLKIDHAVPTRLLNTARKHKKPAPVGGSSKSRRAAARAQALARKRAKDVKLPPGITLTPIRTSVDKSAGQLPKAPKAAKGSDSNPQGTKVPGKLYSLPLPQTDMGRLWPVIDRTRDLLVMARNEPAFLFPWGRGWGWQMRDADGKDCKRDDPAVHIAELDAWKVVIDKVEALQSAMVALAVVFDGGKRRFSSRTLWRWLDSEAQGNLRAAFATMGAVCQAVGRDIILVLGDPTRKKKKKKGGEGADLPFKYDVAPEFSHDAPTRSQLLASVEHSLGMVLAALQQQLSTDMRHAYEGHWAPMGGGPISPKMNTCPMNEEHALIYAMMISQSVIDAAIALDKAAAAATQFRKKKAALPTSGTMRKQYSTGPRETDGTSERPLSPLGREARKRSGVQLSHVHLDEEGGTPQTDGLEGNGFGPSPHSHNGDINHVPAQDEPCLHNVGHMNGIPQPCPAVCACPCASCHIGRVGHAPDGAPAGDELAYSTKRADWKKVESNQFVDLSLDDEDDMKGHSMRPGWQKLKQPRKARLDHEDSLSRRDAEHDAPPEGLRTFRAWFRDQTAFLWPALEGLLLVHFTRHVLRGLKLIAKAPRTHKGQEGITRGRLFQFGFKYWLVCAGFLLLVLALSPIHHSRVHRWNGIWMFVTATTVMLPKVEATAFKAVLRCIATFSAAGTGYVIMMDERVAGEPAIISAILFCFTLVACYNITCPYRYAVYLFIETLNMIVLCQYVPPNAMSLLPPCSENDTLIDREPRGNLEDDIEDGEFPLECALPNEVGVVQPRTGTATYALSRAATIVIGSISVVLGNVLMPWYASQQARVCLSRALVETDRIYSRLWSNLLSEASRCKAEYEDKFNDRSRRRATHGSTDGGGAEEEGEDGEGEGEQDQDEAAMTALAAESDAEVDKLQQEIQGGSSRRRGASRPRKKDKKAAKTPVAKTSPPSLDVMRQNLVSVQLMLRDEVVSWRRGVLVMPPVVCEAHATMTKLANRITSLSLIGGAPPRMTGVYTGHGVHMFAHQLRNEIHEMLIATDEVVQISARRLRHPGDSDKLVHELVTEGHKQEERRGLLGWLFPRKKKIKPMLSGSYFVALDAAADNKFCLQGLLGAIKRLENARDRFWRRYHDIRMDLFHGDMRRMPGGFNEDTPMFLNADDVFLLKSWQFAHMAFLDKIMLVAKEVAAADGEVEENWIMM